MRRIRVPIALALTLSVPGVAFAAPPTPTAPAEAAPVAPTPDSADLSEEEKLERAKQQYVAAEGLAAEGRWEEAVPLYEEAYYLVPGKHGFAHKVGVAAFNAGDCDKANSYLKHFLKYGDPEKHGDKIAEAKQILGEVSVSGCATQEPTETGGTSGTTTDNANPTDDEDPLGASTKSERQHDAAAARKAKKDEKRGLLIGGATLTAVGVVGVGIGIIGLGVANGASNSLTDLSTNLTQTGFPTGDYACRNVAADQCPFELEQKLRTGNILGYVGLGIGGAALAAGVAMLAIHMVNKKKNGGGETNPDAEGKPAIEVSGLGPLMLPGGGGGAMVELRF